MKINQQSEVLRRLHCTAGHLSAVIKMVDDNESCELVLHQLAAIDAAIQAAGVRLIQCQAQASQSIILESPSPEQRSDELKRLQSLYAILLRNSKHYAEVHHE
jgi:DNA-binding FrmR family transcriptional regulator